MYVIMLQACLLRLSDHCLKLSLFEYANCDKNVTYFAVEGGAHVEPAACLVINVCSIISTSAVECLQRPILYWVGVHLCC